MICILPLILPHNSNTSPMIEYFFSNSPGGPSGVIERSGNIPNMKELHTPLELIKKKNVRDTFVIISLTLQTENNDVL